MAAEVHSASLPPSFLLRPVHALLSLPHLGGDRDGADANNLLSLTADGAVWRARQLAFEPVHPLCHTPALSCSPPRTLLRARFLAAPGGDETSTAAALATALGTDSAAVLLLSTAPIPLAPAGLEALTVNLSASVSSQLVPLRVFGAVVCTSVCHAGDLALLLQLCTRRLRALTAALHAAQLTPFRDSFAFKEAAARSVGRVELRLPLRLAGAAADTCPVTRLALHGPWMSLVRRALCCSAPVVTASFILAHPGAVAQPWHADGPHIGPPGVGPHALCVFVPLIDVNDSLGPTQFWLGSHARSGMVELAPRALPVLYSCPGAVLSATLPGGHAVVYDYRLVHRGGPHSGELQRPMLQCVYRTAGGGTTSAWDEGHNFGMDSCDALALPPGHAWAAPADAGHGGADAAAGAAWWAQQLSEEGSTEVAAQPVPPSAAVQATPGHSAAWSVFD